MRGPMTHLDSGVLAEFRAGLICGRRGARIAAHLAVCDRCSAVCDQLAGVSALLAAVPAPRMPDSVAQRLDTALAAELARRDNSERAGAPGSHDPVTPPRRAGRRGLRLVTVRVLAPAAIVVLAAAGYGLSRIGGSSTGSSSAAGSVAAPAATNARAGSASAPMSRAGLVPAVRTPSSGVVTSSTNYGPAGLRQQLEGELARHAPAAGSLPQSLPAQLQACVDRVTTAVSPGTPVLVEKAHFQGQPATVIVAASGGGYTAWVLAPGCSATHDHVLARATLPGTSAP